MPVEVVHWNPVRRRSGVLGAVLPKKPVNNFGDLIGPILVARIAEELRLDDPRDNRRLVSVGSILHLAQAGDVVWGAGVNGKELDTPLAGGLDVRAVRGPHTRAVLQAEGIDTPAVYGDPALLWSRFWPLAGYRDGVSEGDLTEVTVVPNLHDFRGQRDESIVSPIGSPFDVIRRIAMSRFVCGSSLHGIVIAESFGIPARLISPGTEPRFKYDDYYAGTGRPGYRAAESVAEALDLGGEPPAEYDEGELLTAFPVDLWGHSR
ncbi:polysaccharide pyruvyl transferase family protein [Microbacterium sp. ZW T5_45]|uniref:polysaccharide pyruvyl transferase family protein n=1 Tax=Microbacterium sp. ZW T5_45 TaxID=3378080 RepID=UPI003852778F